jgi:hypothetical protein
MRYVLLSFLLFFAAASLHGQGNSHVLNGYLKVKDGADYAYKVVFDVSGATISGYSITRMPDGTETRAAIKGLLNKQKHVLLLAETKLLSAPQKDVTICLVNAILTYKKRKGNYVIAGKFAGQDSDKKYCGEGSVEFLEPIAGNKLFQEDTVANPTDQTQDGMSEVKTEQDSDKITAGIQKQFNWVSDTCIIEIWDGGVIDGDAVSVLLNDHAVLSNYTLAKEKKLLRLPLTKKTNTVTIIAENEGINPPNTAQLVLHDGGIQYSLTAFNKQGEKATIVIKKR